MLESFKIEKKMENAIMYIHSQLTGEERGSVKMELSNDRKDLFDNNTKFQSFLFTCMFSKYVSCEEIRKETFTFLTIVFSSPSMRKWLAVMVTASSTSTKIQKKMPSSYKQSSFEQKLQKSILKILHVLVVMLYEDSPSVSRLSLNDYHQVLQFTFKLLSILPLGFQTKNMAVSVLSTSLNVFEHYFSRIFEVIFSNVFHSFSSAAKNNTVDDLIQDPRTTSPQRKKKDDKQLLVGTQEINNVFDEDRVGRLFRDVSKNFSSISKESMSWLLNFAKYYSNNIQYHHFFFFEEALKQKLSFSDSSSLKVILSSLPERHWTRICLSSSSDRIPVFLLFLVFTELSLKNKVNKPFLSFQVFLTKNYISLFLSLDYRAVFCSFLFHLHHSDNDDERDFFLYCIQAVLRYEGEVGNDIILLRTSSNNSFSSTPHAFSLLSILQIIVSVDYGRSSNHALRVAACDTLSSFNLVHWETFAVLLAHEDNKLRNSLQTALFRWIRDLTEDVIGTVRTAVFRAIGEIISTCPQFLLHLMQFNTSSLNDGYLFADCVRGCRDTKLSVRIQSTFALNKFMIHYPNVFCQASSSLDNVEKDNVLLTLYDLYVQLLGDSEKIRTTALLGMGYVVHFLCSSREGVLASSLSSSSLEKVVDRLLVLFDSIILNGFNLQELWETANSERKEYISSKLLSLFTTSASKKFVCSNTQTMSYVLYHFYCFLWMSLKNRQLSLIEPVINRTAEGLSIGFDIFVYFTENNSFLQLQLLSLRSLNLLLILLTLYPLGSHIAPFHPVPCYLR
jgi:hypothetical protein